MSLYERCVRGFFGAIPWGILFCGALLVASIVRDGDPMAEAWVAIGFAVLAASLTHLFVRFILFISFGPAEQQHPFVAYPETHVHVYYPGENKIRGERSTHVVMDDPFNVGPAERVEPHLDCIDADFQEVNHAQRPQLTASRADRISDGRGRR